MNKFLARNTGLIGSFAAVTLGAGVGFMAVAVHRNDKAIWDGALTAAIAGCALTSLAAKGSILEKEMN